MATGKIMKRTVEAIALPETGKRAYLWDDTLNGFGVMVMPTGVRSYLIQYRLGGRGFPTRRATIGRHGGPWTPDTARNRAAELLEMVRKGIDPVEADRARQAELRAAKESSGRLAFAAYADLFMERHVGKRGLRSAEDIATVFRRDLTPHFGSKPITVITKSDILACLEVIYDRSPSAANKAHKWLRKMINFALGRGDLVSSPILGIEPPHIEVERDRVLSVGELQHVWEASAAMSAPFRTMTRLLVLTGQRLREVAGMSWSEIDMEARTWAIPGERTKNKRPHLVPLSDEVITVLIEAEPEARRRAGYVMSTTGHSPISGFSKAKVNLDKAVALPPWVFHDLRRSVATGLQGLGIPIAHTEAVLNHVSGTRGGIIGTYQLYEYQAEKTRALAAWGKHVMGSQTDNVITMRGVAR